ncbi:MAG: type II secretion system F family protein [Fibrobacterota bacterium]|nr:type II secretion system F family protein [Fibrobacterota bacterium]
MSKWLYKGKTTQGKEVAGEVEASNKADVEILLRKKRIRAMSIKRKPMDLKLSFGGGVPLKVMARFTRQFSAMTSAGLPLIQCLDILSEQTEHEVLKQAIMQVATDIQGGGTLADSLSKHKKIFSELYCQMIAAGEAGGILDTILLRLAEYQEKADALRRKIKGAMTYPVIVAVVAVAAVTILMVFVVPIFANMFAEGNNKLPLPTRIVMGISDFIRNWILAILVGSGVGLFSLFRYYKTEKGRLKCDQLLLAAPVLGDLERKSCISRFTRTLGTLLNSGVSIIDALQVTAKTSGNKVLELGIYKTLESISGGQTIADPLRATGVFPPMVIQMIAVGERTGGLSEMLIKISDFYDDEVDAAVDNLTSMIEPLVIVVLGSIIGGVLVAMYLPMFEMAGTVG